MGGGGGVAEGAAEGEAPEAKRDTPRWDGIGVARSRKKGACRALRPRREAAREWEEAAMCGRGGAARLGWGLTGFGLRSCPFPPAGCWPCCSGGRGEACGGSVGRWPTGADCLSLAAAGRLYWAVPCLARLEIGTGQPEFTLTCRTFSVAVVTSAYCQSLH